MMGRCITIVSILTSGCAEEPISPPSPPPTPVVSIVSPVDGVQILDGTVVEVSATDDKGIVKVEVYIDNSLDSTHVFLVPPYRFAWDVSSLPDSSLHTIYSKAYDADGNQTSTPVHTVLVNRFGPSNLQVNVANGVILNLGWQDNCQFETGFEVEQSYDGLNFTLLNAYPRDVTSVNYLFDFSVSELYYLRVRAIADSTTSGYSNTVHVYSETLLYAGTASGVFGWDGANWSSFGNPPGGGNVSALTSFFELLAGRDVGSIGGPFKWDGTSWLTIAGGVDGYVHSFESYQGNLVVGGLFGSAGGKSANNVATLDFSWSALGTGVNDRVYALKVFEDELYAGGTFTAAGSVAANYIARWNGSTWRPVDSGLDGEVVSLEVFNNELYAGANNIAKWNGSTWAPVGAGMNNTIFQLKVYRNEMYAGGAFTDAGGVAANRVAKWNGTTWEPVGSGMNERVFAMEVYEDELFAGGLFTTADGLAAGNIAKWNGTTWSPVGSLNDVRSLHLHSYWTWVSLP